MLATTLDVDFDPDKSWDEKKEIYRISNKIVRTSNVTQIGRGRQARPVDHYDCRRHPDLRLVNVYAGAKALEAIRGLFLRLGGSGLGRGND